MTSLGSSSLDHDGPPTHHSSIVLSSLSATQRKVLSVLDVDNKGEVNTAILEKFVLVDRIEKRLMTRAIVGLAIFLVASVCINVGTVAVVSQRAKTVTVSGSDNALVSARTGEPVNAMATVQLLTSVGLASTLPNSFFETLHTIKLVNSGTSTFTVTGFTRANGAVILQAASPAVPYFLLSATSLTPVSSADSELAAAVSQAVFDASLSALQGSPGALALAASGAQSVDAATVVCTQRMTPK